MVVKKGMKKWYVILAAILAFIMVTSTSVVAVGVVSTSSKEVSTPSSATPTSTTKSSTTPSESSNSGTVPVDAKNNDNSFVTPYMENDPPIADAGGPYCGYLNVPITFDGSDSYDTDGNIISWSWNFGDGHTGSGEATSHTYSNIGTYIVTLTVHDDYGAYDTDTTTATVTPAPPVAVIAAPDYGDANESITFNGAGSYDPDGTIINWTWNFGDGGIGYGSIVNYEYKNGGGTYTVTLTVKDNNQTQGSASVSIDIREIIFIINPDPNYDIGINVNISFGCEIVGCSPSSFDWDFGDGTQGCAQQVEHSYPHEDEYDVSLVVSVPDQGTLEGSVTVYIIDNNGNGEQANSVPGPSNSYSGKINEEITFDGSESTGGGNNPLVTYIWYFGDGQIGYGETASHSYSTAPENGFIASLTVEDTENNVDAKDITVTITDDISYSSQSLDENSFGYVISSIPSASSSVTFLSNQMLLGNFHMYNIKNLLFTFASLSDYYGRTIFNPPPTGPLSFGGYDNNERNVKADKIVPIKNDAGTQIIALDVYISFDNITLGTDFNIYIYEDSSKNHLYESHTYFVHNLTGYDSCRVGLQQTNWPAGSSKYVEVFADPNNILPEYNEDDNWCNQTIITVSVGSLYCAINNDLLANSVSLESSYTSLGSYSVGYSNSVGIGSTAVQYGSYDL